MRHPTHLGTFDSTRGKSAGCAADCGPPVLALFHLPTSLVLLRCNCTPQTIMKPLLQHASRTLAQGSVARNTSRFTTASFGRVERCLPCQHRAASTLVWKSFDAPSCPRSLKRWSARQFTTSMRRMEEGRPSHSSKPIPMPSPAAGRVEDRAPELVASIEGQERLQEASEDPIKGQNNDPPRTPLDERVPEHLPTLEAQERMQEAEAPASTRDRVIDNISRVPDEHLPSHRARQRWDFSKRFSELMDEVLPKLAVVTHKVNTYTGTDYSGVEALRREIKEQGTCSIYSTCSSS